MAGTFQADAYQNSAGTGAPTFTFGLATATGQPVQADVITNSAGTGAPNFSKGLTATNFGTINSVASTNYTILTTDGYNVIEVTTGASTRTITLPAVASSGNRVITIAKIDSGAGAVTITPNSGNINGNATWTLNVQNSFVTLYCDASNWYISASSSNIVTPINAVSSANYTILPTDGYNVVEITTGASGRTVTLPAVASSANRTITIKKIDSGAGTVTITPNGGNIEGATTTFLSIQGSWITLYSDGSNWYSLGAYDYIFASATSTFTQSSAVANTYYDPTNGSVSLPPGAWSLQAFGILSYSQGADATNQSYPQMAIRDSSNTLLVSTVGAVTSATALALSGSITPITLNYFVANLTTTTTYKISIRQVSEGGTGGASVNINLRADGAANYGTGYYLNAIRNK